MNLNAEDWKEFRNTFPRAAAWMDKRSLIREREQLQREVDSGRLQMDPRRKVMGRSTSPGTRCVVCRSAEFRLESKTMSLTQEQAARITIEETLGLEHAEDNDEQAAFREKVKPEIEQAKADGKEIVIPND